MDDATTKHYAGRRDDCVLINTTIDRDAWVFMRQYCPAGRRATGRFLSRLIYEHEARQTERQRLQERLQAVVGAD